MTSAPLFGFLFVNPLAALLTTAGAAALAVAVPVIIHLLNRKRFRVVTWAAMRFLRAAQRKNARRLRLEQLLLLAVRCLVVLLLALAMACVMPWADKWVWPNLFPNGTALAASAAGRRTHRILVVDGSFSMATKAGDTTCFERARALAEQIVEESPRGDSFSVVLMAAPPRRIVSEPSEDGRKVAAEVRKLRLPHGNADLLATLNAVEDLLRQSPGKFQDREVYFLTDLQQSTWVSGPVAGSTSAAAPTALAAVLQKIQSKARTVFVDVGEDVTSNLAVTNLALGSSLATPATVTPIVATLHNYGPDTRDQVRVELLVGKARATAADPPFELRVAQQAVVKLGRGQNTVSFPYKFATPGDYVVQVRLENDSLDLDDVRSAVVTVRNTVPVLLVNGRLVEGRPQGALADTATEWLRIALNPFDTPAAPGNFPARPKVVNENEFDDAGAGDLTPFDCVFLCDVKQFTPAEVRRLETHLRRGGGVVFCLGPQVDVGAYNEFLYKNGAGILPAKLVGKETAPASAFFHLSAEERAFQLPPLDAFADDNDRVSLTLPRFREYFRAELPPPARGARKVLSFMPALNVPGKPGQAQELERLPVGEPALVEWQPSIPAARDEAARSGDTAPRAARVRGRVLLLTTPVNMDWSTWPAYRSYLPLMQEVLNFAVSGRLREQAITVGDPLEEFLSSAGGGLDVALHTPDGRTEALRTEVYEDGSALRWADTDISGVYRATIGQHPQEHLFAVNVPTAADGQAASESDLTRTNADELHRTYPDWGFQLVRDPHEVSHTGGPSEAAAEAPRESPGPFFAHGLLLAMLALVLLEVVLAWRFGHYSAVAGAPGGPAATGRMLPVLVSIAAAVVVFGVGAVLIQAAWSGDFLSFLPDVSRQAMERGLGIPAPAAGEGSRWRLEFAPYLWDAVADPWLAGLIAVVGGALIVWIYRQEGKTASGGYKVLLACLRISLLLLTVAVLLPQLRLWFERQGWPDVAILIDDSASMSTTDKYQDAQVQAAADRLAQSAQLSAPDRLALARVLITHPNTDWINRLLTERKVKVHVYHCSGRAHRLADVTTPAEAKKALEQVRGLRAEPHNDSSQLGTAVRQVLNDFRGSSLAAVVMLTDGVTTEGEDLVKVSRYAAQYGVPLYFVGIGDDHEQRDLALHDLQCEDSVYVNDQIVFELRLTGHGYPNLTVPVRLREKGKEAVLDKQDVTVDPQGKPVKVRLTHRPTETGVKNYVIDVPVQQDEADPDNNKVERAVEVQDTRLFKVLYVEGAPRWEYRYVKTLLEREAARKGNKSIDLKVLLLDADPDYAAEDRSALAEFPLKTDLNNFDVVILGDADPKDPKLGDKNVQALADFVRERGGGLLMIAGQRYSPYVWKNTPLADVLPVEVDRDQPPEEPEGGRLEGYHPELTPLGRLHPIFRFSPDDQRNEEIWGRLREMYWWAEGYHVKPAAEVLAVQPKVRAAGGDLYPLVVQQFVGAGRCMFFGFDETWRWRWREDELRFNQFWIQTVRYLARSRLGRIELRLDRQAPYRRGEPIKVTVRFPDDAAPPGPETEVKVVVERRPPRRPGMGDDQAKSAAPVEVQTMQLARVEGSRSTFEGLLTRTPEGEYQFWLSAPAVTGTKPRAECRVLAPPGEMELLRMNAADMERAAEESHGRFYTLAEADHLLADLPAGTRVTLNSPGPPLLFWNHAAVFGLALFFLSSEWLLRKRKHLL